MPIFIQINMLFSTKKFASVGAPLLAGCNKDESDQKSATNIYKSVYISHPGDEN